MRGARLRAYGNFLGVQPLSLILDSYRRTVMRFGFSEMSKKLGKAESTLRHELDPNCTTAKLGVEDAALITMFSGDISGLSATADECGYVLVPKEKFFEDSDHQEPSLGFAASTFGSFMTCVGELDGPITPNQLRVVERKAHGLIVAVQSVVTKLRGTNKKRETA
jgi:hypothetical protein